MINILQGLTNLVIPSKLYFLSGLRKKFKQTTGIRIEDVASLGVTAQFREAEKGVRKAGEAIGDLFNKKDDKIKSAQANLTKVERAIQNEQVGRERRSQVKASLVAQAGVTATNLASGGRAGSSGNIVAGNEAINNRNVNLGNFNTDIISGNQLSSAKQAVSDASKKTKGNVFGRIAGTGIGAFAGGPAGAAIGGEVGSAIFE